MVRTHFDDQLWNVEIQLRCHLRECATVLSEVLPYDFHVDPSVDHLARWGVCLQRGAVDQFEQLVIEGILEVEAMVVVVVLEDEFIGSVDLGLLRDD